MEATSTGEYDIYLRKSNGRKPIPRQRGLTLAHIQSIGATPCTEFSDADRTAYRRPGEPLPVRPDFLRLLTRLAANRGLGIAAYHADRVLRDPEDAETLIRICAAGRNPIETPSGRYELWTATGRKRIREDASAAAYEVDHNRERVLAGRLEVAEQGRWLGGKRPYGWEADPAPARDDGAPLLDADGEPVHGILRLVPAEAAAIAQAHQDLLDGMSLSGIARGWNDAGLRTPLAGGLWRHEDIRRLLRRSRNAGLMQHQGKITGAASWPRIVDEPVWRAVVAILDDTSRKTTTGPARANLLSFLATCGAKDCGQPVVVSGPRTERKYRCRADTRGHVARAKDDVEKFVVRIVLGRLAKPDAVDLLQRDVSEDRAQLHRAQVSVQALMQEENDLRKRQLLTAAEFAESRTEHLADLERIKDQQSQLLHADVLAPLIVRIREEAPEDYEGQLLIWNDYPLDRRRGVIDTLMSVRIMPARKGRPAGWRVGDKYFDPEGVQIGWKR